MGVSNTKYQLVDGLGSKLKSYPQNVFKEIFVESYNAELIISIIHMNRNRKYLYCWIVFSSGAIESIYIPNESQTPLKKISPQKSIPLFCFTSLQETQKEFSPGCWFLNGKVYVIKVEITCILVYIFHLSHSTKDNAREAKTPSIICG